MERYVCRILDIPSLVYAGVTQGNMLQMKLRSAYLIASVGLLFLACDNPFFPRTGEPLKVDTGRKTPAGVIDQLYRSYETRQINLFMDLFSPTKDFRFYVSPSFVTDYVNEHGSANIEIIDSSFSYAYARVLDRKAYYWTYDDEIQIHNNMFSEAVSIQFTQTPQPVDSNSINYFTAPDGTQYAEVVVRDGMLLITAKTPYDRVVDDYPVDIGVQVYYLERDPRNPSLWVIAKWFDLGTAQ
jgi:hypothetical protein